MGEISACLQATFSWRCCCWRPVKMQEHSDSTAQVFESVGGTRRERPKDWQRQKSQGWQLTLADDSVWKLPQQVSVNTSHIREEQDNGKKLGGKNLLLLRLRAGLR